MNTKELTEQNEQNLKNEHEIWLKHPITTQLLKAIDTYEKSTVNALVRDLSPTNTLATYHHGCCLRACKDIRNIITDPEKFVKASITQL